ncbi:MAG: hypothetical protein AAGH45_02280, partial [Pseudomonadota bacterium]
TLGYADTEFTDFETNGQNFTGNEFGGAADWSYALGGAYFFANGVEAHLDGSFTNNYFMDADNDPVTKADSRFLLNGRLLYATDVWSLGVFGRNLLDEVYVNQRSLNAAEGVDVIRPGEPRVVGVQGNVKF